MPLPPPPKAKNKPVDQTFEEVKYLKQLIEARMPVTVKLDDDTEVRGTIEYYDVAFIRLTREGEPNLFLFKDHIKYIAEGTGASSETP
jgi:host factor-I protein